MATQTIVRDAIEQSAGYKQLSKQVLTLEETLEQNARQYAFTAGDDPARAEFVASLMGLLGIDNSEGTSERMLNTDTSERYPKYEKSFRPVEETLERNAPLYSALTEGDPARAEFGAALNLR